MGEYVEGCVTVYFDASSVDIDIDESDGFDDLERAAEYCREQALERLAENPLDYVSIDYDDAMDCLTLENDGEDVVERSNDGTILCPESIDCEECGRKRCGDATDHEERMIDPKRGGWVCMNCGAKVDRG